MIPTQAWLGLGVGNVVSFLKPGAWRSERETGSSPIAARALIAFRWAVWSYSGSNGAAKGKNRSSDPV